MNSSTPLTIPVGYPVKYYIGYNNFTGWVNKVMYPGYQYSLTQGLENRYRYCITNSNDYNLSAIVTDTSITDPSGLKCLTNREYIAKYLPIFDKFKSDQLPNMTFKSFKSKLIEISKLLNKLSYKVPIKIQAKGKYFNLSKITHKYDKVSLIGDFKSPTMTVADLVRAIPSTTPKLIKIYPGEFNLKSLEITENHVELVGDF